MGSHSIQEAGNQFAALVARAIAGEDVLLTKDGKAAVQICAVPAGPEPAVKRVTKEGLARLAENRPVRRGATEDAGAFVSRMRAEDWER